MTMPLDHREQRFQLWCEEHAERQRSLLEEARGMESERQGARSGSRHVFEDLDASDLKFFDRL